MKTSDVDASKTRNSASAVLDSYTNTLSVSKWANNEYNGQTMNAGVMSTIDDGLRTGRVYSLDGINGGRYYIGGLNDGNMYIGTQDRTGGFGSSQYIAGMLAHEGTHAYQDYLGLNPNSRYSEYAAHAAQKAVENGQGHHTLTAEELNTINNGYEYSTVNNPSYADVNGYQYGDGSVEANPYTAEGITQAYLDVYGETPSEELLQQLVALAAQEMMFGGSENLEAVCRLVVEQYGAGTQEDEIVMETPEGETGQGQNNNNGDSHIIAAAQSSRPTGNTGGGGSGNASSVVEKFALAAKILGFYEKNIKNVNREKYGQSVTKSSFFGINMGDLNSYSIQDLNKIESFMKNYFTNTTDRTIMIEVAGRKIITEPYQATKNSFIRQTVFGSERQRILNSIPEQYRSLNAYLTKNKLADTPANRQKYANDATWAVVNSSTANACNNCSLASAQLSNVALQRTLAKKIKEKIEAVKNAINFTIGFQQEMLKRELAQLQKYFSSNGNELNVDEISKRMRTLAVSGNSQTEPISNQAALENLNNVINALRSGNNAEIERINREQPDLIIRIGMTTLKGKTLSWENPKQRSAIIKQIQQRGNITIRTDTGIRTLTNGNAEGAFIVQGNPSSNACFFDAGWLENAQAGAYQWFSDILSPDELNTFGIKNNCLPVAGCSGESNYSTLTKRLTSLKSNENLSDFVILINKSHYVRPVEIRDGIVYVQDSDVSPGGQIHALNCKQWDLKKLANGNMGITVR